jgi:hypothetical protein
MEEEMGRACSKHEGDEKVVQSFGKKNFFIGFVWPSE